MRLDIEAPCEIWLKLECLQPIGSFKLRGATSAIRQAGRDEWHAGVWTTSAGNMAQGVCWVARELGVPATVVAPDHAPRAKLDAIARLGGEVIPVPFDTWWETMERGSYPGLDGLFVHPVLDERGFSSSRSGWTGSPPWSSRGAAAGSPAASRARSRPRRPRQG